MAPRKATTLSALVDPMSEDEFANTEGDMMLAAETVAENRQPTKKRANTRVAGSAARVTKAKAPARRTSGANLLTTAKNKGKRKALVERSDVSRTDGNETGEVDAFDDQTRNTITGNDTAIPAAKPVRKRQTKSKTAQAAPKAPAKGRRGGAVPQIQLDPMQIEQTMLEDDDPTPKEIVRPQAPAVNRSRSLSRQPDPVGGRRRRAGSASSTERGNDPGLRRKLGDITKKFENLDLKYRNLKEVALTEAHDNFEKLRKTTEKKAQDQEDIIASLKRELTAQKALVAEGKTMRSQLSQVQTENTKLAAENKTLSSNLQDLQTEVKSLTVKLSAARSTSVDGRSNANVPGSAVKTAHQRGNSSQSIKGPDPAIERLKEDLYSDLTGLMIRNVKRLDEEDIYDCIQTGRNGTLHFHLSISHLPPASTTPGGSGGYDDIEFAYTPLLDEKNDKDLLEILPDYLMEEICFPRSSAAKFYAKVGDCMNRKVEIVE